MSIQIEENKIYSVKGSLILLCAELLGELKYKDAKYHESRFQVIKEIKMEEVPEVQSEEQ
jgi:hypothetical protein